MKKDVMLSCRCGRRPRDRALRSRDLCSLFTLSPQTWFGVFDPDTIYM